MLTLLLLLLPVFFLLCKKNMFYVPFFLFFLMSNRTLGMKNVETASFTLLSPPCSSDKNISLQFIIPIVDFVAFTVYSNYNFLPCTRTVFFFFYIILYSTLQRLANHKIIQYAARTTTTTTTITITITKLNVGKNMRNKKNYKHYAFLQLFYSCFFAV